MEFSELIRTGQAQAELLRGPEAPPLRGTLCVTGHHLLLSPGPQATPDLWLLLLRSVDSIEKRVAGDCGTITLRCKDLRVLQLDIEGVEATLNIARSIEALSSLESVITSFPFFYRPKGLRLGDAWHFHPPERYYKRVAREVLLRSSQPLIGPQKRRCAEDEALLRAVLAGSRPGARGFIVDTRSAQTAKQARMTGGGTEAKAAYPGWKRLHRPLERGRPLQESFVHLVEACGDLEQSMDHWLSRLAGCRWLAHVKEALSTACLAAQGMEREGACILVHGAEGTDSTLVVTSLAQLILDPSSRTMAGFQELVEREWIQAGHPFQLRCAHSAFSHARPKHEAPTFLLFLDCVWQLGRQFPLSLEFGEGMLLALFDHAYASPFGTFLCNSEQERCLCEVRTRTHSLWSGLNQLKEQRKLRNPLYVPNPLALWPSVEPQSLRLWQGLFLRWTRPPEPSEAAWEKVWQIVTDQEKTEGSQPTVSASELQL
ncbi:myotubularin-related protein 9-like isoform X3 [Camelus ferus]|uniref:Myotubularin-related protein 9-like isoform X3 n=2 Tax=Camelus TaxID=9836 RepID=A0A8B8UBI0_CAMFR|nr:myotubularin-related protein 9-like isoform X1 [Camelus dromedarius]XP_032351688.1 myotubularin-related protein 9-like isoform X3 [Camelus ferus]XP_045370599.1 myotubularin-related protein 9-like isoform X3 [Camelus bactrianus]